MILFTCISMAAEWTDNAEYRAIGTMGSPLLLNDDGASLEGGFDLDQRLRLGVDAKAKDWRFGAELDALSGQVFHSTWNIPGEEDDRRRWADDSFSLAGLQPRRLSAGIDTKVGKFDLGLMPSQWGMGLLANDGTGDPLFGRTDFGDRSIRARYLTQTPGGWTMAAIADLVAVDDSADIMQGQAAGQAILAALYGARGPSTFGVYGVFRHQVENAFDAAGNERRTNAVVLDMYGRVQRPVGKWTLDASAEGAGIYGHTNRSLSYNSPESLEVLSTGAATRLVLTGPKERLATHLRLGYATGDGAPDDDEQNAFAFDRDFDAGIVLFDEVMGGLDAAAYAQLSDPEYSGQAPDGADQLVGEGAVRGATFVQPAIVVQPRPWLGVRLGAVIAWSTAPIAQPFQTFRNGGVPTNAYGDPTEGYYLGSEIDWALTLGDLSPPGGNAITKPKFRPSLWIQGGHGFLSSDLGGERVDLVSVAGRVRI